MNAPAYQDIAAYILARIHAGEWVEGVQILSEKELACKFGVARMTVNRAQHELTAEQVLTRAKGSRTFAARSKYKSTMVTFRNFSDEVVALGNRHHATMLHIGAGIADAALADEMLVRTGSPVFHSGRCSRRRRSLASSLSARPGR